jgi:hypothetical protein
MRCIAPLVLVLMLTACGGSSTSHAAATSSAPPSTSQPAAAQASASALAPSAALTCSTVVDTGTNWGAPRLPDNPSIRMGVWKGEVIASTEEELLSGI